MIRRLAALAAALALPAAGAAHAASVQPYDHIFVIMEENHEYSQIIGNQNAPNINSYAKTYGLATKYDAVKHPSAPNYVALTGGSNFRHPRRQSLAAAQDQCAEPDQRARCGR